MRVQERQRVNSEGLFSLAANGKDGAQRRGEGKIMEIFGPLCTASLPLSPSVITELKFLTCTDKITFLGSCDKMMSHNSPLPTEKTQKKIELILWDCSFLLLASREYMPISSLHVENNVDFFPESDWGGGRFDLFCCLWQASHCSLWYTVQRDALLWAELGHL